MECAKCGVAYDVGKKFCAEKGCEMQPAVIDKTAKSRVRKQYVRPDKVVDPIQSRLQSTRLRSKKRGFGHDLDAQFITELLTEPCAYCLSVGGIQIDRKDNSKGYLKTNVVPACKRCNTVKSMYLTYDQMMVVAEALGWRSA